MSLSITILVSAILVILLALAFSSRAIIVLRHLATILNLDGLFDLEPASSLDKIFYKYRHNSIKAWSHWISKQTNDIKNEALEMLLEHFNGNPGNWGMISPRAVKAIELFLQGNNSEKLVKELQSINDTCKKYWLKFKITQKMHQACWETIISLDHDQALKLLGTEFESIQAGETEIYISIVNAFQGFKKETDISDVLSEMLTHSKLAYEVKRRCIELMEEHREEDENKKTIIQSFKKLIKYKTPMDPDDLGKVLTRILNLVTENIDDNITKAIVQLSNDKTYGQACSQALTSLIKNNDANLFEPEILYCFTTCKNKSINQLIRTIAKAFALNTAETELCLSEESEFTEFKVNPLAYEKIKEFAVPEGMKNEYEAVKNSIKSAQGIELTLISGDSEEDKLYLSRAVAAYERSTFIYVKYSDLENSELVVQDLEEKANHLKPLLIYISGVDSLLQTMNVNLANKIKKLALDSRIKLVLTCRAELGKFTIPKELGGMLNRKPVEIPHLSKVEKNRIFKDKLSRLQQKNKSGGSDTDAVVDSIQVVSRFDFHTKLDNYFRAGLLSTGKIIDLEQYRAFEAKAKSLRESAIA